MKDGAGYTALMLASIRGHVDIVAALLNHSASINMANACGSTALMSASNYGRVDIIETLL